MESFEKPSSNEKTSESGGGQGENAQRSQAEIMKYNADVMTVEQPLYTTDEELERARERLDEERERRAQQEGTVPEADSESERVKAEEKLKAAYRQKIEDMEEEKGAEEYVAEGEAMKTMLGGEEEVVESAGGPDNKEKKGPGKKRNDEALKTAERIEGRVNGLYECINVIESEGELSAEQKKRLQEEGLAADTEAIREKIKLLGPDMSTAASMAVARTGIEGHRELSSEGRLDFKDLEHNSGALLNGIRGLKESLEMEMLTSEQRKSVQKIAKEEGSNQWSVFSHYHKDDKVKGPRNSENTSREQAEGSSQGEYKIKGGEADRFWNLLFKQNDMGNKKASLKALCDVTGRSEYKEMISDSDLKLDSGQDASGRIFLKAIWRGADNAERKMDFSIDMRGYKPGFWMSNFLGFTRSHAVDITVNDYAEKPKSEESGQSSEDDKEDEPGREEGATGSPEDEDASDGKEGSKGEGAVTEIKDIEKDYPLTAKFFTALSDELDGGSEDAMILECCESLLKDRADSVKEYINKLIDGAETELESDEWEEDYKVKIRKVINKGKAALEELDRKTDKGRGDDEGQREKNNERDGSKEVRERYRQTFKYFEFCRRFFAADAKLMADVNKAEESLLVSEIGPAKDLIANAIKIQRDEMKQSGADNDDMKGILQMLLDIQSELEGKSADEPEKKDPKNEPKQSHKNKEGEEVQSSKEKSDGFINLTKEQVREVEAARALIIENRASQVSRGNSRVQGLLGIIKEKVGIDADQYERNINIRLQENQAFTLRFEKNGETVEVTVDMSKLEEGKIAITRDGGEIKKDKPEFDDIEVRHFNPAQEYEVDDDTLEKIKSLGVEKASLSDSEAVKALLKAINFQAKHEIEAQTGVLVEKRSSHDGKISVSAKLLYGGEEEAVDFIIDLNASQATKKIKIEHLARP